jgi:hypothetical protein
VSRASLHPDATSRTDLRLSIPRQFFPHPRAFRQDRRVLIRFNRSLRPLQSVESGVSVGRNLRFNWSAWSGRSAVTTSGRSTATTVQLLPLSQSEIRSKSSEFLSRAFRGKPPAIGERVVAEDLVAAVLSGGYPEALGRTSWNRRQLWYRDYIDSIIQRDVRDMAEIDRIKDMSRLLRVLAHHSGQLVRRATRLLPLQGQGKERSRYRHRGR